MYQQSYVPKSMIVFLQIIGTVFATIGLIVYISMMNKVSNAIGSNDATSKAIASLILALIVYLTWKTIYTAVVIIRFVKSSSDEDISANRFIISALSLNLGGFVTPFIISMMPNIATKSTINPRWFLTRAMGITSSVGGVLALAAFFISALTGQSGGLTASQLFDTSETAGIISVIVLVLGLMITLFGIISVTLFYQKSSQQSFADNNNKFANMMNIVAVIWLAVLTIELCLTMVFAILRLVGAISDLLQSMRSDGFSKILFFMFALMNLVFTVVYVGYILHIIARTIVGLWTKDGVIEYQPYQRLVNLRQSRQQGNTFTYA